MNIAQKLALILQYKFFQPRVEIRLSLERETDVITELAGNFRPEILISAPQHSAKFS